MTSIRRYIKSGIASFLFFFLEPKFLFIFDDLFFVVLCFCIGAGITSLVLAACFFCSTVEIRVAHRRTTYDSSYILEICYEFRIVLNTQIPVNTSARNGKIKKV